ncbi:MAG: secretin and TonB N-terminal domain-containing protein, partial [Ignavibacteriales bacterium]
MAKSSQRSHARLMCGAAAAALLLCAGAAQAETTGKVEIAPQPLASALNQFGVQTGMQVIFAPALTGAKTTHGVSAEGNVELALAQLLDGTGLGYRRDGDTFLIVSASDPQSGSAAGDGADQGTVAALVVTAQKKEENIQDVPIAISAFTEKSLQEQKIEGGFDLLKAIPNVTFSKNNFSGYNFSIRGIGTKAISVTTDPGV